MAEAQQSENQGGKEVEIEQVTKLLQSLDSVLSENRDALTILPEFLRERVHELEANPTRNARTFTANNTGSQGDGNYYKSKFKDLKAKLRAKDEELKAKQERIAELERELGLKQDQYIKETEQNKQKFAEKEEILTEQKKEMERLKEENKKTLEDQQTRFHQLEARLHSEKLDRERAKQHYTDELRDKEAKMRSLEVSNKELTRELEGHRTRGENLSAEVEKSKMELRHYIERFHHQEETYKSELSLKEIDLIKTKERLTHREKEINSLSHDVQRYKSRLASMCEKRVNQDQRSVENVLASNPPSDVESDFRGFFDSDREDARDVIQSLYESEKEEDVRLYYPRIVCTILVAAYKVTKDVKEASVDLLEKSVEKMIQQAPEVGRDFNLKRMDDNFVSYSISIDGCDKSEKSTDVIDALLNSLKESAHICDLECLEKDVSEFAWKIWSEWYEENSSFTLAPSQKVLTELRGYIKACLRLTWRMVTQLPPLRLEYNSSNFDHRIHRKFSHCVSSTENQANGDTSVEEIAYYLWPGLSDGGKKLLYPGLVLCKMQQNK